MNNYLLNIHNLHRYDFHTDLMDQVLLQFVIVPKNTVHQASIVYQHDPATAKENHNYRIFNEFTKLFDYFDRGDLDPLEVVKRMFGFSDFMMQELGDNIRPVVDIVAAFIAKHQPLRQVSHELMDEVKRGQEYTIDSFEWGTEHKPFKDPRQSGMMAWQMLRINLFDSFSHATPFLLLNLAYNLKHNNFRSDGTGPNIGELIPAHEVHARITDLVDKAFKDIPNNLFDKLSKDDKERIHFEALKFINKYAPSRPHTHNIVDEAYELPKGSTVVLIDPPQHASHSHFDLIKGLECKVMGYDGSNIVLELPNGKTLSIWHRRVTPKVNREDTYQVVDEDKEPWLMPGKEVTVNQSFSKVYFIGGYNNPQPLKMGTVGTVLEVGTDGLIKVKFPQGNMHIDIAYLSPYYTRSTNHEVVDEACKVDESNNGHWEHAAVGDTILALRNINWENDSAKWTLEKGDTTEITKVEGNSIFVKNPVFPGFRFDKSMLIAKEEDADVYCRLIPRRDSNHQVTDESADKDDWSNAKVGDLVLAVRNINWEGNGRYPDWVLAAGDTAEIVRIEGDKLFIDNPSTPQIHLNTSYLRSSRSNPYCRLIKSRSTTHQITDESMRPLNNRVKDFLSEAEIQAKPQEPAKEAEVAQEEPSMKANSFGKGMELFQDMAGYKLRFRAELNGRGPSILVNIDLLTNEPDKESVWTTVVVNPEAKTFTDERQVSSTAYRGESYLELLRMISFLNNKQEREALEKVATSPAWKAAEIFWQEVLVSCGLK